MTPTEPPEGIVGDPLRRRHAALMARIGAACDSAGRDVREVRVLPATKGRDPAFLDALHALGYRSFGESRIGEFVRKRAERPGYGWEFIGRFRVEDAALLARDTAMIHSVVSPAQAEALDRAAAALRRPVSVLLQVNLAADPRKQGLGAAEATRLAEGWTYPHLALRGIMVLGPVTEDPAELDALFGRGRELFERLRSSGGVGVDTLSMGMSGDFEAAVRAGATVVRIGGYLAEAWSGPNPPSR